MFTQNNIKMQKHNCPKETKEWWQYNLQNMKLLNGKHASEMRNHWTSEQSLLTHHQCDAVVYEESPKSSSSNDYDYLV